MSDKNVALVPAKLSNASQDLLDIFHDEALHASDEELKAYAYQLLRAGTTMTKTAKALGIRLSTLWTWAEEPAFADALRAGTALRRELLARKILDAGDTAITALDTIAGDVAVDAKERVKAATAILDRAGAKFGLGDVTTPTTEQQAPQVQVVNVQFASRLDALVSGQVAPDNGAGQGPRIIEGTAVQQLPRPPQPRVAPPPPDLHNTHNTDGPTPLCPDPNEDEHDQAE